MKQTSRIYVAGGDTLIGVALRDRLRFSGFQHIVGEPPNEPELTDDRQVEGFFSEMRPEYVFLTAGKTGGIRANQERPAQLMHHNLLVATHVLYAAHVHGVAKLLYLASSCSYPKDAPQPWQPEALWSGQVEHTSAAYAMAKLAGIQLCQAYRQQFGSTFICGIPASPFGPHDDFDPATGHVVGALMRRMQDARQRGERELILWGTGKPLREFIYSQDLADACVFVMTHYDEPEPINLGSGTELSIAELATLIADVVGYRGRIRFDPSRPDGMPRKALDSSRLFALGWRPKTNLRSALEKTCSWFRPHLIKEESDVPATV